jgi:hypothetical protein
MYAPITDPGGRGQPRRPPRHSARV